MADLSKYELALNTANSILIMNDSGDEDKEQPVEAVILSTAVIDLLTELQIAREDTARLDDYEKGHFIIFHSLDMSNKNWKLNGIKYLTLRDAIDAARGTK